MTLRRALLVPAVAVGLLLALVMPGRAVVGGTPSGLGANPFMASVQFNFIHICGGSVIAPRWVLTAAHCVPDADPTGLYVVTGTNVNVFATGVETAVTSIVVHPQYDDNHHDAALLELASPVSAPPITLSGSGDDDLEAPGSPVTVAGWGDTNPATMGLGALPVMTEAELAVVSDADCAAPNPGFDAATGVCAEALGRDSCQGDSGGPLFAKVGTSSIQVGIVSYGLLCAIPGQPGVYSEVNNTDIRSWISATAGV